MPSGVLGSLTLCGVAVSQPGHQEQEDGMVIRGCCGHHTPRYCFCCDVLTCALRLHISPAPWKVHALRLIAIRLIVAQARSPAGAVVGLMVPCSGSYKLSSLTMFPLNFLLPSRWPPAHHPFSWAETRPAAWAYSQEKPPGKSWQGARCPQDSPPQSPWQTFQPPNPIPPLETALLLAQAKPQVQVCLLATL